MKIADMVAGTIGILIGSWVIYEGSKMPPDYVMKIGPSFFPNILAGGLILFSLVLIFNAVKGRAKGSVAAMRWSDPGARRGAITLGAAVVFCAVLKPVGFILTALVFLTFMMVVLGRKKPRDLALIPAGVTLGIWLIFEKLLHLEMPQGVLASLLG